MNLAYLTNQYPGISHTFIRREIAALESGVVSVARFSIRRCAKNDVVDMADRNELAHTRTVLDVRSVGLILGIVRVALTRPTRLARAIWTAVRVGWRSDRGVLRHLAYLAEACVLLGWLKQCGAQHLHAHFGTNPAAVAMLCRELGGPPYSFTVHGPSEFDRATVLALDEKISRAEFVVAISEYCRSQLYRWCGPRHWSKIHVVRCGLDESFLDRPETRIPSAPRLVCVGRLSEQKGQLLLIEAAKRLAADHVDFELVLVGDGEMRLQVERAIVEHDLADRVKITGWASNHEVRGEMLASRALCLPSFAEGLPVVIMEALALGRPVVSTFVAGIPELVRPGVNGWLVPAGSVDGLVSAMREALTAPVERLETMGRAGAARVAELHDARVEAGKLAALFRKSIENDL